MPIGIDPVASYTYHVEIDGLVIAQFKEVSGLSVTITVIEHRENKLGGLPVLKKLPGVIDYPDIVLKRGRINDPAFWNWIKQVQDGQIDAARRHGSVTLFDYAHGMVSKFDFINGWPSKVDIGTLGADSNTVLLESVTITHEGLTW